VAVGAVIAAGVATVNSASALAGTWPSSSNRFAEEDPFAAMPTTPETEALETAGAQPVTSEMAKRYHGEGLRRSLTNAHQTKSAALVLC